MVVTFTYRPAQVATTTNWEVRVESASGWKGLHNAKGTWWETESDPTSIKQAINCDNKWLYRHPVLASKLGSVDSNRGQLMTLNAGELMFCGPIPNMDDAINTADLR